MKQFLEIGKIVATRGVRGEVRVQPWSDSPEFLCEFDMLYLDEGKKTIEIERSFVQKNVVVMKLKGIDTVEKAQEMRNSILYMDRDDVELPEGSYFVQDLIGLSVIDADNNEKIGVLSDVTETGANDVYHIKAEKKEYLIPAIPDVIEKVDIEKGKGGKTNVVISEIPYPMIGANISKFLMDVAALSETKKTMDIVDISNQSSKEGIRIVIELKRDADVDNFVNMLYKKTRLEDTFGVNMLAIANGRPETMSLKQVIKCNVDFQFEVATRKYQTMLEKELAKKEIQEGLIKACNVIDLIIEILRGSRDRAMAKACLVEGKTEGIHFKYKESKVMAAQLCFSENQANAILDMRLYKLIGLEIQALIKEHEETMANIYRYEDILERRDSMAQVIMNELDDIKKAFSRPRRTVIENAAEAVYEEKKVEEMDVVFLMDRFGYAKCVDTTTYERNKEAADAENKFVFTCKNTGKICIFTNTGQLHTVKVMDIPYGKFRDKGIPIDNISNYNSEKEMMINVTSQTSLNLYRVIFVTGQSMMKIVDGGEFDVAKRTVAATKLQDNDEVVSVEILDGQKNIVLQTKEGFFSKFPVEEIPEKKKGAVGVRGMKLGPKDSVESVHYTGAGFEQTILYKDKPLELGRLKLGKRDSKGTKVRG